MRRWWTVVAMVVALAATGTSAWAADGVTPVPGPVVGGFNPPDVRWGSGHRGVDILAEAGADVVAPASGTVSFAGQVAGRPVLVIDLGQTRTTLEPVEARVAVGTRVVAGQVVGRLAAGHTCAAASCLHWGLLRGEQYLDPLSLLAPHEVRLLPDDAAAGVRERAAQREAASEREAAGSRGPDAAALAVAPLGSGVLSRPVPGGIGSRFGMRFHPIFHEWRMHAGVDLHAGCGTPIRAAADGTVTHVGYDSSGGWRLTLDHGSVGGSRLTTSYLHAQGYSVRAGQQVSRGQVVGSVGSTGWSTGCHLHFGVRANGALSDPAGWLGLG